MKRAVPVKLLQDRVKKIIVREIGENFAEVNCPKHSLPQNFRPL